MHTRDVVFGLALACSMACADEEPNDSAMQEANEANVADADCGFDCPDTVRGTVEVRYLVTAVYYASPATGNCDDRTVVEYPAGSRLGTTVSAGGNFVEGYTLETKVVAPEDGHTARVYRVDQQTTALTLAKPDNTQTTVRSDCQGGINHDSDLIVLSYPEKLDVSLLDDRVLWTFGANQSELHQIALSVRSLKDPASIPSNVREELDRFGISDADFPDILKADPLAQGTPDALDPTRFVQSRNGVFLPSPGSAPDHFSINGLPRSSALEDVSYEYAAPLTIDGSDEFQEQLRAALRDPERWTWTASNAGFDLVGEAPLAEVIMSAPDADYSGPTEYDLYYDTMFQTLVWFK